MEAKKNIKSKFNIVWPVILLGVFSATFLNLGMGLLGLYELSNGYVKARNNLYAMGNLELLLYAGILMPVLEEIIFRGLIYSGLKKLFKSLYFPTIISAFAFGIYHKNILQFIYAFAMGLFMVYVFEKYDRIFSSVIFHMSANIFVMLTKPVGFFYTKAGQVLGTIVGFIMCLLLVVWENKEIIKNDRGLLVEKIFYFLNKAAWVVGILLILIFGLHKTGYYIDEYYTYTLSNGSQLGIGIQMDSWCDTKDFFAQLVSEGNENFQFQQCYVNNENDVHPPLYYFLIHLTSSLVPGIFSKWIGIGVNIFLWCIAYYIYMLLAREIFGKNSKLETICLLAYALSPAILSGAMLIRMYVQLQLFVMLYAYILIKDMKRERIDIRNFLIPVFFTGFAGFLTQYYFVIAMFFLSFFYALHLIVCKKQLIRLVVFGATALAGLVATYFVWPVSVFHIFKGYRGADSVNALIDNDNIIERLKLFGGNLNDNLYGGFLILVIAAVVYIISKWIFDNIKSEKKPMNILVAALDKGGMVLGLSGLCYFTIIMKIGLKAEAASNRYEYPVYGIFLILTVYVFNKLAENIRLIMKNKPAEGFELIVTGILLILIIGGAYIKEQVLYLYPEERIIEEYKTDNPNSQMVMFCKDDGGYDTRIKDYLSYERVYFANSENPANLRDEELGRAESLLVYIEEKADEEACLNAIKELSGLHNSKFLLKVKTGGFRVWSLSR